MGKIENDELRKIRNEHFIRAFEYVKKVLKMGQGELAETIGSKNPYISNFRNGTRLVPDETVEALIRISASKPGLQIFSEYLYGNSDIMLLANVTDEEMAEASQRKLNPDYDVMKKRKADAEQPTPQPEQRPSIDPSSELNAALSAYVQLTNRLTDDLKRKEQELSDRLADRDAVIAEKSARILTLERTISDKEEIIRARDARIAQLESQLAEIHLQDISRYPFALGAAEGKNTQMFPQTPE